ncbi:tRNA preQ1(34) S-adenosylmethionine ribosyltransferase-isomerase QueA [Blattabacterium cuenoti]|uniref:tRNA preQ1(34) S-adenosylmethionine ribosyltransferase-isomerase QueA n=1 Tax=Blattabacterium cuenoti TaxID=1653831 RepID=UPI00163D1AA7|nr:tRNA preQ1(34) S-adenosylmethionine ribosyltransferase-isomerase QueA [Blattabacterium cuenoti]
MRTSDFNFQFPLDLLANYPSKERDESKLMVIHKKHQIIEHKLFKDLYHYFNEGDTLILNNTKVFPARLFGNKDKTEAKIEVFLLRELDTIDRTWDVLVDPARKVRVGNKLNFGHGLTGEVIDNTTSRGRILQLHFMGNHKDLIKKIKEIGKTPLPKYINRSPEKIDKLRYQTIYAKIEGSVAAPTAGLHFSKHLLKKLEIKGINIVEITLHIGLGSFLPVEVEDISKHKMDSEKCFIESNICDIVNQSLKQKKMICAVGTSSMRAIESSVSSNKNLNPFSGWTNKFIFPPYNFNIANCMITNFHMPKSTLLMMTSAFIGYNLLMKAYKIAIENKYRLYSYGDSMLILP